MARLRSNPPAQVNGVDVRITDLSLGSETLPATDGLRFDLADGRRVIVRPSGTEPKLKCYLQVVEETTDAAAASLKALDGAMRELLG
jgi:phosphomannomutase